MAIANILNFFTQMQSVSFDPICDYYQDMVLGQPYYIFNMEYPNYYRPGTNCRWLAVSPVNSKIIISCEDIDIPPTATCQSGRLSISLSGNTNFVDANNYCGKGTISLVTQANKIAMGLFTSFASRPGRFLCTIAAIQAETLPPPVTTTERPPSCDCGWRQNKKIVGGVETKVNEYPAMGALIDLENRNLFCGASIISTKYGLTAAHCVRNREASSTAFLVGDHNVNSGTDTASAALYVLEKIEAHPDYSSTTEENDIALIKTQRNIDFNSDVGPICLPFRYSTASFTDSSVTALGWGTLEFSGIKSNTLQAVNLTVISNSECSSRSTSKPIFNSQICTYTPGKDSCQNDSGGPLLWLDPDSKRLQLVGAISYGLGCASSVPGVNTRITNYLAWVVSMTPDTEYCIK